MITEEFLKSRLIFLSMKRLNCNFTFYKLRLNNCLEDCKCDISNAVIPKESVNSKVMFINVPSH